jgi:LmbE family N-acetylglucosaminyl deacetylase
MPIISGTTIIMKIVVVSAHPDDLEIGCAGTLKYFQDQGADITSVITVAPSAEVNAARDCNIVSAELQKSYSQSGWNLRVFSTPLHANGRPNLTCDNNTMSELAELIDSCDLAIIPNPQDSHQDHRTTYDLAWPIVQRRAREVWCMHSWPYCYHYQQNSANMYVGINWDFKRQLLECYDSYLTAPDIEKIHTLNRMWGHKSGHKEAEAFELIYKYV